MPNEQVAEALERFVVAASETLRVLAADKPEPIGEQAADAAIDRVLRPLTEAFGGLPALPTERQERIAGCTDACTEVVEPWRRLDNLGGQRLHRESFEANVFEIEDQASWVLEALRAAAAPRIRSEAPAAERQAEDERVFQPRMDGDPDMRLESLPAGPGEP